MLVKGGRAKRAKKKRERQERWKGITVRLFTEGKGRKKKERDRGGENKAPLCSPK